MNGGGWIANYKKLSMNFIDGFFVVQLLLYITDIVIYLSIMSGLISITSLFLVKVYAIFEIKGGNMLN